jgi:hypothetical protein
VVVNDSTYDPVTRTVADDDGGRLSVFELSDCPRCGGHLTHCPGSLGGGIDQVLCLDTACRFYAHDGHPLGTDVADLLIDPGRVMPVLSGKGWTIAFVPATDGDAAAYINPDTGTKYDTGDVETEYRNALAGGGEMTATIRGRCVGTRLGGVLCDGVDPRSEIDLSTTLPRTLSVGSLRCQCGRCGRHFGGVSAFDSHQRLDTGGFVLCIYPGDVGLSVITDTRGAWWSRPLADATALQGRAR